MGSAIRHTLAAHWKCVLERTCRAQEWARKVSHFEPEYRLLARRLTLGAALLGVSVLLGISAQEQTLKQGRLSLERENPPSTSLWKQVLTSQGYQEVSTPSIRSAVSRLHPGRWDSPGEVWLASSGLDQRDPPQPPAWITILSDVGPAESAALLIFRKIDCPPPPGEARPILAKRPRRNSRPRQRPRLEEQGHSTVPPPRSQDWIPLGTGWAALSSWSARSNLAAATPNCSPPPLGEERPSSDRRFQGQEKADFRALRY
jgi:hypothetical protein